MKSQMDELQDDLKVCNEVLADKTAQLEAVLAELENVKQDRNQKTHLLKKHVVTEKKLSSQAKQLLSTTEEATATLDKLYKKVDRKKYAFILY